MKKLKISKRTISSLTGHQMSSIKGGYSYTCYTTTSTTVYGCQSAVTYCGCPTGVCGSTSCSLDVCATNGGCTGLTYGGC